MILALDPSSTCVGYALMTGARPEQLLDGGLLRPKPAKLPVLLRVRQFAQDLRELLAEHRPAVVVMEVSLSCHGRANDRGGASTLGVYGFAVGYLYHVQEASGIRVETVEATQWTERLKKSKRTARIRAMYGSRYPASRDPGGDLADAIGIGRWWLQRHPLPSLPPLRAAENALLFARSLPMNVPTLDMPAGAAAAKAREYSAAVAGDKYPSTPEGRRQRSIDIAAAKGFKAIAAGKTVINVHTALSYAGL